LFVFEEEKWILKIERDKKEDKINWSAVYFWGSIIPDLDSCHQIITSLKTAPAVKDAPRRVLFIF